MTADDAPADAPPAPAGNERKLSRSKDQRVIAGVCGGLSRYAGVDPLLFRIGLAVLVFFGGVGAVIYLAGWLFLPEDGDSASPVEALLGRGQSSTSPLTTVILGVAGVLALGIALGSDEALLLALAVLGIALLVRRGPATPASGDIPLAGTAVPPTPVPAAYAPHGPYGGSVGATAAPPPPPAFLPPPPPMPPMPPMPPKPPRERSALGRIVVSATLLALGLMLAADRLFDASISGPAYLAVALGMVGAGLAAGAWIGRARSLIALGVALCVALAVSTAASDWEPSAAAGDQRWAPATAAAIDPSYEVGFGEATLDLTNVDFTDASADTRIDVGVGHLLVLVPSDVDVTVRGTAGAGSVNLFGMQRSGSDANRTVTDLGADGPGGGTLKLNVEIGVGALEVLRG